MPMLSITFRFNTGFPKEPYESFSKSFDEVISLRPLELQLDF